MRVKKYKIDHQKELSPITIDQVIGRNYSIEDRILSHLVFYTKIVVDNLSKSSQRKLERYKLLGWKVKRVNSFDTPTRMDVVYLEKTESRSQYLQEQRKDWDVAPVNLYCSIDEIIDVPDPRHDRLEDIDNRPFSKVGNTDKYSRSSLLDGAVPQLSDQSGWRASFVYEDNKDFRARPAIRRFCKAVSVYIEPMKDIKRRMEREYGWGGYLRKAAISMVKAEASRYPESVPDGYQFPQEDREIRDEDLDTILNNQQLRYRDEAYEVMVGQFIKGEKS